MTLWLVCLFAGGLGNGGRGGGWWCASVHPGGGLVVCGFDNGWLWGGLWPDVEGVHYWKI